jgi:nucleoside phosphorylase
MSKFTEAKSHFLNFVQQKREEYSADSREFRVWPKGGYPDFYKSHDIINAQNNIAGNFEENFYDLDTIAPETTIRKWSSFLEYLDGMLSTCIGVIEKYRKKSEAVNEHLPYPLIKITNNIQEVVDELKYVLSLSQEGESGNGVILLQEENNIQQLPAQLSEIVSGFKSEKPHKVKENPFGDESYDIAIVTAIHIEFVHVVRLLKNPKEIHKKDGTKVSYCIGSFIEGDKNLKVVVACANQMGMTAAGVVALNLAYKTFPTILIMTGICAGIGGKVGDILIPESLWDYGSGKRDLRDKASSKGAQPVQENTFKQYRSTAQISPSFIGRMCELQNQRKYLDGILSGYQNPTWTSLPDIISTHIGPFSSGSAVIANDNILDEIKSQDGKLIGFDMEAYAIAYACQNIDIRPRPIPLIFKSTSDGGDKNKNHKYKEEHQDFAAYTSANYMYNIVMFELDTFMSDID